MQNFLTVCLPVVRLYRAEVGALKLIEMMFQNGVSSSQKPHCVYKDWSVNTSEEVSPCTTYHVQYANTLRDQTQNDLNANAGGTYK